MPAPTDPDELPAGTAIFLPGPAHSLNRPRDGQRHGWARWVSLAGAAATGLSLPVVGYQVTASSLWPALVLVAGCLPHLAGVLASGAIARWPNRQRLRVTADWANAALLASVPIAFALDALTAPHVLVVAFGAQALFVCFDAAGGGTTAVGRGATRGWDRLGRPLSIGSTAALLTAPVLAAALLLLTAVSPLLTVDGLSLVVAGLLARAIAPGSEAPAAPPVPRPGLGGGLRRRLVALRSRPADQALVLVCALHAAGGGAFLGQFTPWLDLDLGVRPIRDARLGLLLGSWAVGARLATAVLPRAAARLGSGGLLPPPAADRLVRTGVLPRTAADRLAASAGGRLGRAADRLGGYRVTLVFLPTSALCLLCCAVAPHWVVAAVMLAAWGAAHTVVALDATVAGGGLRLFALALGWPAGALLGGLVAAAAGPRMGLISGVLLVVAAAAVAWLAPLGAADRAVPVADRA